MEGLKKIIVQYAQDTLASVPSNSEHRGELTEEGRRKWLQDISLWTPNNPLFDWDLILDHLTISMWQTAYSRYKAWREGLPKWPLDVGHGPADASEATDGSGSNPNERINFA
jgi:hypothetical protein